MSIPKRDFINDIQHEADFADKYGLPDSYANKMRGLADMLDRNYISVQEAMHTLIRHRVGAYRDEEWSNLDKR